MQESYRSTTERVIGAAVALGLGAAMLAGCKGEVPADSWPGGPVCRTATIEVGDGPYSALARVMEDQMLVDHPDQADGFYSTYVDAGQALSKLRKGHNVVPGDSFIFCNDGIAVHYQENSAKLAK